MKTSPASQLAAALLAVAAAVAPCGAASASDSVPLYFGNGCFWGRQKDYVDAERKVLGRAPDQVTAVVGYAGGTKQGARASPPESCQVTPPAALFSCFPTTFSLRQGGAVRSAITTGRLTVFTSAWVRSLLCQPSVSAHPTCLNRCHCKTQAASPCCSFV